MTATLLHHPEARRAAQGLDAVPPGAKVLWVSSTGGHLAELARIEDRIGASPDSLWVTFETPQTLGFLPGRRHCFVDYVAPRDLGGAVRAAVKAAPLLRRERFDACISTGAALAGTILPLAALAGIPTYYVESLAQPTSPSVTGRLLAWAPGVRTLTQYEGWARRGWCYTGNALDGWCADGAPAAPGPLRILVVLGTIAPYRFDRAVDAVLALLRPGDEVTWQLGATTRTDLPGLVLGQVSSGEIDRLSREADVVVTHCGVGSILQQLDLGRSPVLAVRRSAYREHVDDHQQAFAETTARRGLTTVLDLDRPSRRVLEVAAGRRVTLQQAPVLAVAS